MSIHIPLRAILAVAGFCLPLGLFWLAGGEFVRGEPLTFAVVTSLLFATLGAMFP